MKKQPKGSKTYPAPMSFRFSEQEQKAFIEQEIADLRAILMRSKEPGEKISANKIVFEALKFGFKELRERAKNK